MVHLRNCKCYRVSKGKDACERPSGSKAVEVIGGQMIITLDFSGGHQEAGETRGRSASLEIRQEIRG